MKFNMKVFNGKMKDFNIWQLNKALMGKQSLSSELKDDEK